MNRIVVQLAYNKGAQVCSGPAALHRTRKRARLKHGVMVPRMSVRGSCECKNIEVVWHTIDHGLVP